jgi:glutamate/tyrosine decarboxylase-like PLP-dependent enzyme
LFKDKHDHDLVQDSDVRYLQPEANKGASGPRNERNFGLAARVEGSMGPDAVLMSWATLQLFGEPGIKVLLEHTIMLTDLAFQRTKDSQYLKPLHDPETNTLLVSLKDGASLERMKDIRDRLEANYGYYINLNGKVNYGNPAFRMVFVHPWITPVDVLDMFDKLEGEIKK